MRRHPSDASKFSRYSGTDPRTPGRRVTRREDLMDREEKKQVLKKLRATHAPKTPDRMSTRQITPSGSRPLNWGRSQSLGSNIAHMDVAKTASLESRRGKHKSVQLQNQLEEQPPSKKGKPKTSWSWYN